MANPNGSRFTTVAPLRALLHFVGAYVLVTILAAGLSILYCEAYALPDAQPGQSILEAPAFVATVPYHVLIMVIVWPIFAWLYFRGRRSADAAREWRETAVLGLVWLAAAMVVDFVAFVLLENAWSMTVHELYVVYQPWITLIYLSIFLSPWVRWVLAWPRPT